MNESIKTGHLVIEEFVSSIAELFTIDRKRIEKCIKENGERSLLHSPELFLNGKRQIEKYRALQKLFKLKDAYEDVAYSEKQELCSPEAAAAYIRSQIEDISGRENFVVVYLDMKMRPIYTEITSKGTLSQAAIHPRYIFERSLALKSKRFLVAHNHPSGDVKPSPEDVSSTEALMKEAKILDIELIDHIIVSPKTGRENYCSLKKDGYI